MKAALSICFAIAFSAAPGAQTTAAIGRVPCPIVASGLTKASADARERAARSLYGHCPVSELQSIPNLPDALRKSVQLGNANASALLLLGLFRDADTRTFLEQHLNVTTEKVKLDPWQKPVPLGLAAAAGAVSAGSELGRNRLKAGLGPVEEAEFLTSVLPSIRDNPSLELLLPLLQDERTVATGVPSGASPRRRIADLAVDGYVRRFALKEIAVRMSDRYSPAEIDHVRKLVLAKLRE